MTTARMPITDVLAMDRFQIASITDLREVIGGIAVAGAAEVYAAAVHAPERQWHATTVRLRLERQADKLWKQEGRHKRGRQTPQAAAFNKGARDLQSVKALVSEWESTWGHL